MQVSAIFGIIFALIVMGFVMIFGTGIFQDMMCVGNNGQVTKAYKDLEAVVDQVQALDDGSTKSFRMGIPTGSRICFVDPADPSHNITGDWFPDPNLLIEEEIMDNGYNTWIEYGCGPSTDGFRMQYLVTDKNFCTISGDRVLLTNIGVQVRVEKIG